MPVKMGIPAGFRAGLVKEVENPIYSTAVGLILHRLKSNEKATLKINGKGKRASLKRVIERMRTWFDEL
jgi:cell division ATPase FtsA